MIKFYENMQGFPEIAAEFMEFVKFKLFVLTVDAENDDDDSDSGSGGLMQPVN